jgi:hypothetical protein
MRNSASTHCWQAVQKGTPLPRRTQTAPLQPQHRRCAAQCRAHSGSAPYPLHKDTKRSLRRPSIAMHLGSILHIASPLPYWTFSKGKSDWWPAEDALLSMLVLQRCFGQPERARTSTNLCQAQTRLACTGTRAQRKPRASADLP